MRLIDADALGICKANRNVFDKPEYADGWNSAVAIVEDAPTVDAVEVVRCKDCQFAKPYERNDGKTGYYCQHQNCTFLYGTNWERLFEPIKEANDFCSYGERKVSE